MIVADTTKVQLKIQRMFLSLTVHTRDIRY